MSANITRKTTVTIESDVNDVSVQAPDSEGTVIVKQDDDVIALSKDAAEALIQVLQEMIK